MAAVWKAPVVFVCENNQYMEYTPIGAVTAVARPAADRASAYGLEPIVVDGNDADAVYAVAVDGDRPGAGRRGAVARSRRSTYRHGGHSRADPGKYRPDDEVEAWLARDPIPAYRARCSKRRRRRGDARRDRGRREGQGRRGRAGGPRARPSPIPSVLETQVWADGGSVVAELTVPSADRSASPGHRPGDGARPVGRADRRGRRRGRAACSS